MYNRRSIQKYPNSMGIRMKSEKKSKCIHVLQKKNPCQCPKIGRAPTARGDITTRDGCKISIKIIERKKIQVFAVLSVRSPNEPPLYFTALFTPRLLKATKFFVNYP